MKRTFAGVIGAALSIAATAAQAQTPPAPSPWRAMLDQDLTFAAKTLDAEYIYAKYPGGADWQALRDKALAEARADEDKVTGPEGYEAVLRRFAGRFEDPHLRASFTFAPSSYSWPRFVVQYQGGRYVVVKSETPAVAEGAEIAACDGAPIADAVHQAAPTEGFIKDLESTKASMARVLFLDAKSPLRKRVQSCRIGGQDVSLEWTRIPPDRLAIISAPFSQIRDDEVGWTPFGTTGAWVRLGVFAPDKDAAKAYHKLIDEAPQLRDKSVIVFDIRGNGGGPYDWFMGVIRSLYGPEAAAYYAQARTEITPVFVHPIKYGTAERKARVDPLDTPADVELEATYSAGTKDITSPSGATVYEIVRVPRPTGGPAPANLVHAKVYVLTDYGCASACIGFVDEMKRLPGVTQIGVDTYVDRRSGSPSTFAFPSGSGSISAPMMTRDGRRRGENEPQVPSIKFDGNIDDTVAVKRWVEGVVERTR
jgi:hypothetical protein